jgi:hypothetical protein
MLGSVQFSICRLQLYTIFAAQITTHNPKKYHYHSCSAQWRHARKHQFLSRIFIISVAQLRSFPLVQPRGRYRYAYVSSSFMPACLSLCMQALSDVNNPLLIASHDVTKSVRDLYLWPCTWHLPDKHMPPHKMWPHQHPNFDSWLFQSSNTNIVVLVCNMAACMGFIHISHLPAIKFVFWLWVNDLT